MKPTNQDLKELIASVELAASQGKYDGTVLAALYDYADLREEYADLEQQHEDLEYRAEDLDADLVIAERRIDVLEAQLDDALQKAHA